MLCDLLLPYELPKVSGSSSCAHFFCSHEITEDSNANQTSQTDLEKENFNEKDNDEETMLVSIDLSIG